MLTTKRCRRMRDRIVSSELATKEKKMTSYVDDFLISMSVDVTFKL